MYDSHAIAAINIEQLVTPTDRLLLKSHVARGTRRSFDLSREAELALAASKQRQQAYAAATTMRMRAQRGGRSVIATVALAAGATWLSFALVCLLA